MTTAVPTRPSAPAAGSPGLAQVIASAGGDAQVIVHDRRNALIGTVRYFAAEDEVRSAPAVVPPTVAAS